MIQTSAAIVIHRPIGEVFRFPADLSNIPLWVPGAQVRPLSTGPFGDRTRCEETLMRFGRAVTSVVELKNYQVNEGFDFGSPAIPILLANSCDQVAISRANLEWRVLEVGVSVSQASMRWRLIGTAVSRGRDASSAGRCSVSVGHHMRGRPGRWSPRFRPGARIARRTPL